MKRITLLALAVILLGALAFWWFSPGQVLKRRTQSLLQVLTFEESGTRASRKLGVYSLNALLHEEVELDTPTIDEARGNFDRGDLESAYAWLCGQARRMEFEMRRIHSVEVDGNSGVVEFSVVALVELRTHRPVDGAFRVTFHWLRTANEWRLVRAHWLEAEI